MAQLKSPFLLNLVHAFQSPTEVFLVMPFCQGAPPVAMSAYRLQLTCGFRRRPSVPPDANEEEHVW